MISSRTVGSSASTVYVQSSWFCSNRRLRLAINQIKDPDALSKVCPYFSFAILSSLMRCRASEILPKTYCPAR